MCADTTTVDWARAYNSFQDGWALYSAESKAVDFLLPNKDEIPVIKNWQPTDNHDRIKPTTQQRPAPMLPEQVEENEPTNFSR